MTDEKFTTYYEYHITMVGIPFDIRPFVEAIRWKFSCIDGDPILGDGIKCYATTFYNGCTSVKKAISHLHHYAGILERNGIKVIRRKIELVIYDDRSNKVTGTCSGACPECVLLDSGNIGDLINGNSNR